VRVLPVALTRGLGSGLALAYAALATNRRQIVMENLLPVFAGDERAARHATWRLFRNFGIKIADLLRYESGSQVEPLFRELPARDAFPIPAGRGALLLTVHLGNWEFGAPLLRKLGVNLLVITLAEPGRGFTELRERARQRWGIETLVIGQDAFAFVEVLKRLQAGAVIALLVDRPPPGSGVEVELFDRPFQASVSAAELARASGCALLPVAIPWTQAGYEIVTPPEITYDRAALGDREARRALTQEILRAFAPLIRQHPDQWFHFVPIWPE
jgi:lauroyl/myristoyl acyltransferase